MLVWILSYYLTCWVDYLSSLPFFAIHTEAGILIKQANDKSKCRSSLSIIIIELCWIFSKSLLTNFNYKFYCNYNAVKSLHSHLNKFPALFCYESKYYSNQSVFAVVAFNKEQAEFTIADWTKKKRLLESHKIMFYLKSI